MNGSGAEFVHGLPASQKRYLFNTTMLNMAYLSNMLANITSGTDGLGGYGCAPCFFCNVSGYRALSFLW